MWPYAVLLAVGLFVLVPKLGDFGFWDPWEPKYAESAREMIERDSYIVPYYRQIVRLTKPILVYWGILAGSAVFGLNEFGARIVGVCMALAAMAGVFYAVSRLRGRQAALISALVLGTFPQFYFIARQAMPDVYLFTSLGVCLVFFCLGLFGPDERRNLHFGISYACIALAVLAKGPVIIGTVLLGTLAVYAFTQIDLRELWQTGRRTETLLFTGTAIPATAMVAGLSFTAYLFGTSPAWWGFSEKSRENTAILRVRIEDTFTRAHLSEIILVLVVLGAGEAVYMLVKRGRATGKTPWVSMAFPALVAFTGAASLALGSTAKILAAALLGCLAGVSVVVISAWRFVHQEWLWPIMQPVLKQIGRQLVLFAIVFLVIAGPWHIAIFIKQGHGYMSDFIIKHNINRVGEIVNRSGASEYYLRVLIFGLFPWSCFLPAAVASLIGWWDRSALKRHSLEVFMLIATFVTFAVFTAAATKFAHYLSPIIIPVCVLIGLALDRSLQDRHSPASRLTWIVAAALFVLPAMDILNDGGFRLIVESYTMKSHVPAALAPAEYYKGLIVFAGVCLVCSILVRSRLLLAGLFVAAVLMANHSTAKLIPDLSTHKTMKNLCETWKAEAPGGDSPICFFGDLKHGIFFYTENRIQRMGNREKFQEFVKPDRRAFCIVERDSLPALQQAHRLRNPGSELKIANGTHFRYVLIRNFE
jgi:4-amino-4-deoxy-L-arabinose transferase-like glycosyltransferase